MILQNRIVTFCSHRVGPICVLTHQSHVAVWTCAWTSRFISTLVDFSAWHRRATLGMLISVYLPVPGCFTLYFDIRPVHKWTRKHTHCDCRCV